MKNNFGFTFERTEEGDNRDYADAMRRLEEREKAQMNPATIQPIVNTSNSDSKSRIINSGDFWRIEGVKYNGKTGIYELSKELIPSATQDSLAEFSKTSRANNGFYVGDSRLHYSIFRAIKDSGNTDVRDFLQQNMRTHWMNTLTRVNYNKKDDETIHNYRQKDEKSLDGRIVGPDRFVENGDKKALEILLGTEDIKEINDVSEFINGTKTHIWRVNNIPKNLDERVVRFDANSVGLNLYCIRYPSFVIPAFGVREVA